MTMTPTRPTVAQAMAAIDHLHRLVVKNQETLDSKMNEFDKDVRLTLEQWSKRNAQDKETFSADLDDLKTVVAKKHTELTGRINEIGGVVTSVKQATETSRETTLEVKRAVDALQESFTKTEPVTAPGLQPMVTRAVWDTLQKNPWYPWLKFAVCGLLGILAYHYLFVPVLSRNVAPNMIPNMFRPNIDVNTPQGAATAEVSREPFRSDTESRAAFGRIFVRLDELVRSGQLTEFEGYYNEFGRSMQGAIPGAKYEQWAAFWNRLATVCHRYGNGANDLGAFNANLQSAARIVAGNGANVSGRYDLYENRDPTSNGDSSFATSPANTNAAFNPEPVPWPFVQTHH